MSKIFLNSQEQGIIVFKLWKSLEYYKRLLLSTGLIAAGLAMQFFMQGLLPGIILVFAGTLFLLPRGYDNRVKVGRYDPDAAWETVTEAKLQEFLEFEKKMRKWDRSLIDISNGRGFLTFFILLCVLGFLLVNWALTDNKSYVFLLVNGALLLLPFWMTGLRSIFTVPNVSRRTKIIFKLLADPGIKEKLARHSVDYFMLLKGKEKKIPDDVKFRINIENHHKDFLGLYGQIVMNHVQSTPYPYFYMVLVAKKGYGIAEAYSQYTPDIKVIIKEYKEQGDVEVLVIRQNTDTVRMGYYTDDKRVAFLFNEGLVQAEKIAVK